MDDDTVTLTNGIRIPARSKVAPGTKVAVSLRSEQATAQWPSRSAGRPDCSATGL